MTATLEQARDQICTLVRDALLADATGAEIVNATPTQLLWWNRPGDPPKDPDTAGNPPPWIKVEVRHVAGGQSALAGDAGQIKTTRVGVTTVKLYEGYGSGILFSDKLARVIEKAFSGKTTPGGVWFRRVRTVEYGVDGAWFRTDVLAEFQYDDVL